MVWPEPHLGAETGRHVLRAGKPGPPCPRGIHRGRAISQGGTHLGLGIQRPVTGGIETGRITRGDRTGAARRRHASPLAT